MENYIESLNWRYATKKYDSGKKIPEESLETLKEAVRLSVSSMGLQPYKVIIVENDEVRNRLKAAAGNQPAITDASHLFVFASQVDVNTRHIDAYIENISKTRGVPKESLEGFSNSMQSFISSQSEDARLFWTSKQAYIAMASLINAAAVLKIDATPMEGFNRQEFNRILGLEEMGLTTAVIAAVGYRHPEDRFQHMKKVRKPKEELFITI